MYGLRIIFNNIANTTSYTKDKIIKWKRADSIKVINSDRGLLPKRLRHRTQL